MSEKSVRLDTKKELSEQQKKSLLVMVKNGTSLTQLSRRFSLSTGFLVKELSNLGFNFDGKFFVEKSTGKKYQNLKGLSSLT